MMLPLYQTQSPLGASKRHLPNSFAADYLGASSIGGGSKKRRKEWVNQKGTSPSQSALDSYRSPESVVATLTRQKPVLAPVLGQPNGPGNTDWDLYLLPGTYNAGLQANHPTAPSPVETSLVSPSILNTDLVSSDQNTPAVTFGQEQSLFVSAATFNHCGDITPGSNLATRHHQVEEQGQGFNHHLECINLGTVSWATEEALKIDAYGREVFVALNSQTNNPGSSSDLGYPRSDIYPTPEDFPLQPLLQDRSVPSVAGSSSEARSVMALKSKDNGLTVVAQKLPMDLQPVGSEYVEDEERPYERGDAEYVFIPKTLSGPHLNTSQLEPIEQRSVGAATKSEPANYDLRTSPELSSAWDIILPSQEVDEDDLDDVDCQSDSVDGDTGDAADSHDNAEGSIPCSGKTAKRRQTFNEVDRQETSRTRNKGACLRCKMQRVRCKENPSNPNGSCLTCSLVSKTSKKVIHHVLCVRWKLQDMTLYRTEGLGITERWEGVAVRDVDFANVPEVDIRIIQMDQGLCNEPMTFRVRRFKPQSGDNLYRKWFDKVDRIHKQVDLAPYALADIHETKSIFIKYIDAHSFDCLKRFVSNTHQDTLGSVNDTVRDTYIQAWKHLQTLSEDQQFEEERLFLVNLFRFWFALRHTTGSSWLTGEERLGMAPVNDASYPQVLKGKISTPRMVIAQFDSINTQSVLRNLAKKILGKLEEFIKTRNNNRYFTIFVSCFILLNEITHMTGDRWRHGRDNRDDGGPSLPHFVRHLQESANVILIHWHYYNAEVNPLTVNWDRPAKTPLADLSQDQIMFLINTWQRMKDKEESIRNMWNRGFHHHNLYFVAQMFEQKWTPKKTFRG